MAASMHIVTVHGTWARGRFRNLSSVDLAVAHRNKGSIPWFCEGSAFLSELQRQLNREDIQSTAEVFEWSGANTLAARAEAGLALAVRLAACPQPVLLVAHSHGGNAAIAALQGEAIPTLSLVTIATPFIKLQKSSQEDWIDATAAVAGFVIVPFFAPLFLWKVLEFFGFVVPGGWLDWAALVLAATGSLIALASLLVFYRSSRRSAEAALPNLACILPSRHTLLTLRGYDDEAGLAIGFGAAASFLARVIEGGLRTVLYIDLMLFGIWGITAKLALSQGWVDWGKDALLLIWTIGLAAVLMLPVIYRVARTFFGWEFLWLGPDFAAAVHSAPDLEGKAQLVTLAKPEGAQQGLNHALYNHPSAVREIVKWVVARRNVNA